MKSEILKNRRTALWRGMAPILAGLAFGLTPMMVIAQEDTETDEAETEQEAPDVERIVVTGSRLRTNQNVVAPNPVLSVGEGEIESRGVTRIEDLTNELPQVFAGQSTEVSNGASGTATLDLRGLGAIRTLPLIDGKRLPFGSPFSSPANVNVVPTGLIERVDIVTGGASAVYGSDAIGGVVNFILKRDFEGIEFDMQGAFNQAGNDDGLMKGVLAAADVKDPGQAIDGRELRVSLTMGANTPDGRGNVTSYFQYDNLNAITQDGRDGSACALGSATGEDSFKGVGCVGSGNFRRFFGLATGIDQFQLEDGTLKVFEGGPSETFNFGPFNFFQRPVERFQMYTQAHYELTDSIEAFADMSFNNTKSDAAVAPSASFGFWETNCDNPLIQDQQPITLAEVFGCTPDPDTGEIPDEVPIFASHRMVEGGPRNSNLDLTTWRAVGGLRGTLAEEFDFEVFGQFARVLQTDTSTNDLVIDNVQEAFFVVEDENGNAVCRSGNPDCVPFNIFQRNADGTTRVTQEMVDFVSGVGLTTGETNQWVFGGNVQTDLGRFGIQSPFADSAPGFLIGGEYREDQLVTTPDEISQQADGGFTGVGGPTLPVSGEIRVSEVFFETQIPLISDAPLIQQFAIGGAYRYSDYTTESGNSTNGFNTDTYHVFANWQPIDDLRLRGQFQRSIRAPNVIELFTPQGTGLPNLSAGPNGFFDPCAGDFDPNTGTPEPSASLEQCIATGVSPDQFGSIPDVISGQTQSITGGNPNLAPEESDTITFGAIITPAAIPGLSVSIDYFDIELDDAIAGGVPAQTVLDECIDSADPTFCDLITRDQVGSLIAGTPGVGFQATNLNIATLETSGIDVQAVYDLGLRDVGLDGWGSLRFDYAATYVDELSFTSFPGATPIDCAGKVLGSCGSPSPEYRHRMLNTWQTPWNIMFTATWRYFSSTDNQQGSDVAPFTDIKAERKQYLDLSVNWAATETVEFRAGVNNVTDTDFPILTSAGPALGNGNTFPSTFDTGRFFFFGATYRL